VIVITLIFERRSRSSLRTRRVHQLEMKKMKFYQSLIKF